MKLSRRTFLANAVGTIAATGAATLQMGYDRAHTIRTREITTHSALIPDEFNRLRIAHLADLHCRLKQGFVTPEFISQILNTVNDLRVQLIIISGDLTHKGDPEGLFASLPEFERIRQQGIPVVSTLGNHEYDETTLAEQNKIRTKIEDAGIPVLINQPFYFEYNGNTLPIVGFDDFKNKPQDSKTVEQVMEEFQNEFTVLVTHNADFFHHFSDKIPSWSDFIALSGHTHAGQMLPQKFAQLMLDYKSNFWHKSYPLGEKQMLDVSAGTGFHTLPVRGENIGEIVITTLHKDKKEA